MEEATSELLTLHTLDNMQSIISLAEGNTNLTESIKIQL